VVRTRRRSGLVLLLTLVAAAVLTGRVYDARPGSGRAWLLTYLLAAILVAGSLLSGGVPVTHRRGKRPVVRPFLTALALWLAFLVGGLVLRLLPAFDHGVRQILTRASASGVLAVAAGLVVAAFAEEVFYRGAVFERFRLPVLTATAFHVMATLPAGNVALSCAAAGLGVVLGLQRRTSGGWWVPAVTHASWSLLMVWFTPR
jgi:membrane protease YdiL (CAAX protease family)